MSPTRYEFVYDRRGDDYGPEEDSRGRFVLFHDHVSALAAKDAEIAALRKVVDTARSILTRTSFGILYQKDRDALRDALAELEANKGEY